MSDPLAGASVARVRAALSALGSAAEIVALPGTARTAADAAAAVGCPLGAIVKSLVFELDGRLVLALIAGDRRCDGVVLARALGASNAARRADADRVRAETGFAIGGVAPIGHTTTLPTAIDASLGRFASVYAAAGHPYCVFRTSAAELARLTGGGVVDGLGTNV